MTSDAGVGGRGDTLGTVQRVLHVIQYFAQHRESSLKEMSKALELPPSTCHRLLDILRQEGFIDAVPHKKKYRVGTELLRVCAEIQTSHDIVRIATPFLEHLEEKSGETSVLSLLIPASRKMYYAFKVDSRAILRFDIKLNRPMPLLWGASGLSIAAFLPREEVDLAYESEGSAPATGAPLPSRAELEERLVEVRRAGYAITFGEKVPGAIGIGAPVFRRDGAVIGSLLIVYPSLRIGEDEREPLSRLIRETADRMSALVST